MAQDETDFQENFRLLAEISFGGNFEQTVTSLKLFHSFHAFCFDELTRTNKLNEYRFNNCLRKVRDSHIISGEQYLNLNKI